MFVEVTVRNENVIRDQVCVVLTEKLRTQLAYLCVTVKEKGKDKEREKDRDRQTVKEEVKFFS